MIYLCFDFDLQETKAAPWQKHLYKATVFLADVDYQLQLAKG